MPININTPLEEAWNAYASSQTNYNKIYGLLDLIDLASSQARPCIEHNPEEALKIIKELVVFAKVLDEDLERRAPR